MKKIIMTLALTIFLVGCGMEKEPIEQTIDTANRAQNLADARTVESIISEVELAYSSAYMSSGNYPTIEQIVDKFYMDGIEMDKNGNIKVTNGNVKCTTTTYNSVLSVSCTGGNKTKTTSSSLTILK